MTREIRRGLSGPQLREAPDKHFGRMEVKAYRRDVSGQMPAQFEVYRADQVRTSSILFVGGDWHWRLCDSTGEVLVDAGGYPDEQACRTAVGVLKEQAALATFQPPLQDKV